MDDDLTTKLSASHEIEILPPKRDECLGHGAGTCLCCGRPRSFMHDDGCGICEECLAPSEIWIDAGAVIGSMER